MANVQNQLQPPANAEETGLKQAVDGLLEQLNQADDALKDANKQAEDSLQELETVKAELSQEKKECDNWKKQCVWHFAYTMMFLTLTDALLAASSSSLTNL